MQLAFALTADEFVEGHTTALRESRLGRFFLSWPAVSFAALVVSSLMTAIAWGAGLETETIGGIALAVVPISLWMGYIMTRGHAKQWRKTFAETPAYREEVRWTVSESGIAIASGGSRSSVSWSDFSKLIEGDPVLVLIGSGAGYFVPRRAFRTESDLETFLATVRRHVEKRAG